MKGAWESLSVAPMRGALSMWALPMRTAPMRAAELWRHSCLGTPSGRAVWSQGWLPTIDSELSLESISVELTQGRPTQGRPTQVGPTTVELTLPIATCAGTAAFVAFARVDVATGSFDVVDHTEHEGCLGTYAARLFDLRFDLAEASGHSGRHTNVEDQLVTGAQQVVIFHLHP